MKAVIYKRGQGMAFVENRTLKAPKAGELQIEVLAAAINPVDYKLPAFLMHGRGVGLDVAGVVTTIGSGVTEFKPGDAVFGNCRGALAEMAICKANSVAKKPDGLSFVEAAAMPTAYLTGYQGLTQHRFQAGSKLLVIGASGGCGTAALQLANLMGAAEIVGICSGQNRELAMAAGATDVVDYTTQDALSIYGPGYFDFVYDAASASGGGESYQKLSRQILKRPQPKQGIGMYVALNGKPIQWIRALLGLQSKSNRIIMTKHSKSDLEATIKLMQFESSDSTWQYKPVIEQIYPFDAESVKDGFRQLKSRRVRGKLVFKPLG